MARREGRAPCHLLFGHTLRHLIWIFGSHRLFLATNLVSVRPQKRLSRSVWSVTCLHFSVLICESHGVTHVLGRSSARCDSGVGAKLKKWHKESIFCIILKRNCTSAFQRGTLRGYLKNRHLAEEAEERRRVKEHRHFDACPQRRLHHRRILAFVPTNLPIRDIQARRKHNIVLEGQCRRVQQKTAPRQRAAHKAAPRAPTSLAITRAQARRSSRRAPRRRSSSAVDPRSTSIRPRL